MIYISSLKELYRLLIKEKNAIDGIIELEDFFCDGLGLHHPHSNAYYFLKRYRV